MLIINIFILAPDGKIIVLGGINLDTRYKTTPDIIVLNTQTNPFEWITLIVSSNIGEVPSLAGHTADLIDNYMIVAFGKFYFYYLFKKKNQMKSY